MRRLLILCVVLTAIAVIAAPVFAEVQNVKVSGDVKSTAVYRDNYLLLSDNQLGTSYSKNSSGIITNARVRIDADLTDNVSATVRYLSEYYWDVQDHTGADSSAQDGDGVDLDLAYVTLKEAFYGPLTMMVGRQPLKLGTGFILGDPDTNTTSADADIAYGDLSLRKSFDVMRAVLDYNPLVVDLFYSKIDETNATNAALEEDVDLMGVNAAYDFENYDAEAEVYYMNLKDGETTTAADPDSGTATIKNSFRPVSEVHVLGARGSLTPMDNLGLLGEFAIQRGDYDAISTVKRDLDSYAYQIAADYAFQMDWNPVVRVGFTHYEGEQRDDEGNFEGWIPLFEDQTHGVVANYILGGVNGGQNSNADILNIGVTAEPIEDLTVSVDLYNFWLDEKWVNADNKAVNDSSNGNEAVGWYNLDHGDTDYLCTANDEVGYEIDLALNYDYTEDVRMGLSAGWFVPGDALDGSTATNTNEEVATQVLATIDVAF